MSELKKKRTPDRRIIVTGTLVIVEFKDGRDLVLKKGDIRAQYILSCASLR